MTKKMTKKLKYITALIVALPLIYLLLDQLPKAYSARYALVQVRESIFSETTQDLSPFLAPPEKLMQEHKFLTDSRDDKEALKKSIQAYTPVLPTEQTSVLRTIGAILVTLPREGETTCGTFKNLDDILAKITSKTVSGCCSDYTQAYLALSSALDLFSREVRIPGHVFAETFDKPHNRWIWVDPLFGLTAQMRGKQLSIIELRQAFLDKEPITFINHRNGYTFSEKEMLPIMKDLFTKENFEKISMVLGNNIEEEEELYKDIAVLPKPARQLVAYAMGVKPVTLFYNSESPRHE